MGLTEELYFFSPPRSLYCNVPFPQQQPCGHTVSRRQLGLGLRARQWAGLHVSLFTISLCVKWTVIYYQARPLIWTFQWYPVDCHKIYRKMVISDASSHLPNLLETVRQRDHISLLSLENQDESNTILNGSNI